MMLLIKSAPSYMLHTTDQIPPYRSALHCKGQTLSTLTVMTMILTKETTELFKYRSFLKLKLNAICDSRSKFDSVS